MSTASLAVGITLLKKFLRSLLAWLLSSGGLAVAQECHTDVGSAQEIVVRYIFLASNDVQEDISIDWTTNGAIVYATDCILLLKPTVKIRRTGTDETMRAQIAYVFRYDLPGKRWKFLLREVGASNGQVDEAQEKRIIKAAKSIHD